MGIAQSRLTAQGQISVPAAVRKLLGVGPGASLEWIEENGRIVVRRSGQYTSRAIHEALFPERPARRSLKDLKAGLKAAVAERHARR